MYTEVTLVCHAAQRSKIVRRFGNKELEAFAGSYKYADDQDPISAKYETTDQLRARWYEQHDYEWAGLSSGAGYETVVHRIREEAASRMK